MTSFENWAFKFKLQLELSNFTNRISILAKIFLGVSLRPIYVYMDCVKSLTSVGQFRITGKSEMEINNFAAGVEIHSFYGLLDKLET